nr:alpha/beta hydrolase [Hyphomonadaceae bacterium]
GPVNWYRNFTRNWHACEHIADHVVQPALMIMAENDVVLPPSMADGMEKYVPDLERVLITGCGHWTQQEKPAETTSAIADWIRRRFG